jgi:hypothetical protein
MMCECSEKLMPAPVPRVPLRAEATRHEVGGRVTAFLCGRSDGSDLLHALYDHVLDEPIPQSMLAVLGR